MFRSRFVFAPLIVVGLLLTLPPIAAFASSRNGELCAVQTFDQAIVTSVHRFPYGPAQNASRKQLSDAGAWCSSQLGVRGWVPANKFYDDYTTQAMVCFISSPYWSTYYVVAADTAAWSEAVQNCYDIVGDNPYASISWS